MRIKAVIRNATVLNVLLISAIAVFSLSVLFPLVTAEVRYTLPAAKKHVVEEKEAAPEIESPYISEYTAISEENLFHPQRKIPVEKKAEQPLPKPDFVLYGTLITDTVGMAYLEDRKAPRSTSGRGKRQVALRKGDSLSGFTLKEIESGRIVMVRGDEKVVIPIIDPAHPREAGGTVTPPAAAPQRPQQRPAAVPREPRRPDIQAAREQRRQQIQSTPPSTRRSNISSRTRNREEPDVPD